MIRFLNLKDQICEDSNDFAFYDTVSNTICSFGEEGKQVFSSINDFKSNFGEENKSTTRPLSRFLSLIPNDPSNKNGLHELTTRLENKVESCDTKSKESRARRGAYVDCLLLIRDFIEEHER